MKDPIGGDNHMEIGKTTPGYQTKMGQLMVAAGLISHKNLEETLDSAKLMKLPAGRVMLMAGFINKQTLESVLLAQSMVRDQNVDIESVVRLLVEAHQADTALEELLTDNGWSANAPTAMSEIGELFVAATMLTRAKMRSVLQEVAKDGGSLTKCLLSRKLVSSFDLINGFAAYAMLKHNDLSMKDAVQVLKTAMASGLPFDQALLKCKNVRSKGVIKIGNLLNMSGLLTDVDLLEALETCLMTDAMIGEVFVERGAISRYVLHCALELQEMLMGSVVTVHQAREILLSINAGHGTLEQCITEYNQFSKAVLDLLVDAGALTVDNIRTATEMSSGQLLDLAEILYEQGFIEHNQLDAARRCQRMVVEELVTREHAIGILKSFLRSPGSKPNFEITQAFEMPKDKGSKTAAAQKNGAATQKADAQNAQQKDAQKHQAKKHAAPQDDFQTDQALGFWKSYGQKDHSLKDNSQQKENSQKDNSNKDDLEKQGFWKKDSTQK